jgi:hypothetical protein
MHPLLNFRLWIGVKYCRELVAVLQKQISVLENVFVGTILLQMWGYRISIDPACKEVRVASGHAVRISTDPAYNQVVQIVYRPCG